MKKKFYRSIAQFLAFVMMLIMMPITTFAAETEGQAPAGYITMSVEKFTLGGGYIVEPINVPFYPGDSVGSVLPRVLGDGNYNGGSNTSSIGYLASVKDPSPKAVVSPEFIQDYIDENYGGKLSDREKADWLNQMDYVPTSGWIYWVNQTVPNVGMPGWKCSGGDTARIQFSMIGLGADLGIDGYGNLDYKFEPANKNALMQKVASINGSANKTALLANPEIKAAYDGAYEILTQLEAKQEHVDVALTKLTSATQSFEKQITYDLNGVVGQVSDSFKTVKQIPGEIVKLPGATDVTVNNNSESFKAWNTSPDGTGTTYALGSTILMPENGIKLYAIWDKSYKVSYDANLTNGGGESTVNVDDKDYFENDNVRVLNIKDAKPTQGKLFKEWNTSADGTGTSYKPDAIFKMGKENVTLYAIWGDAHNITYDMNGFNVENPEGHYGLVGQEFYVENYYSPEMDAHKVFAGWSTEKDGTGVILDPIKNEKVAIADHDIVLYAIFKDGVGIYYDLQIPGEESNAPETEFYLPGSVAETQSGSGLVDHPEGKLFKNWNTKKDGSGTSYNNYAQITVGSEDITLYAIWETPYKVTYNLNGGAGSTPEEKFNLAGKRVYFPWVGDVVPPQGTEFIGWNTKQDGNGDLYIGSFIMPAHDVDLYAIYKDSKAPEEPTKPVIAIKDISISSTAQVEKGGTVSLKAHKLPESATEPLEIRWKSSDNNIATVDDNGVVTGISEGTVIITASLASNSDIKAQCKVTVVTKANSLSKSVEDILNETRGYILSIDKNPAKGSEWFVIGLARGGMDINSDYFNTYYNHMVNYLNEKDGKLTNTVKYTEYSKAIIAMTAIGKDARNIGGYNLLANLADFNEIKKQGINGPIWALIALKTNPDYVIPEVSGVSKQTTEEVLIDYILSNQKSDGGWNLSGKSGDVDLTGMTLQALAPYYNKEGREKVTVAINKALSFLSKNQLEDGGFATSGVETSESNAQVITALCSLGIDPEADQRFIKNGYWSVENILKYHISDSGFMHVKAEAGNNGGAEAGMVDGMATEQAHYALVAYDRLKNEKTSLYDMSDLSIKAGGSGDDSGTGINNGNSKQEEHGKELNDKISTGINNENSKPEVELNKVENNISSILSEAIEGKSVPEVSKTTDTAKKKDKKSVDKKITKDSKKDEEGWNFIGEEYEGSEDSLDGGLEGKVNETEGTRVSSNKILKEYLPYSLCILCGAAVVGVCIYFRKKK
ncbi:InlB B-repeat-containing protein [Clostridium sp.]|uniref:InlB B-repeat-containing protein n=1 Tax=Clostridium sp. TaxID=1506 RepID=UPI00346464E0